MYNCSASRPSISGKTNEEGKEVQTETLTIKSRPLANGLVKAKTGNSTTDAVYAKWYQEVYLPTEATEEEPEEEPGEVTEPETEGTQSGGTDTGNTEPDGTENEDPVDAGEDESVG